MLHVDFNKFVYMCAKNEKETNNYHPCHRFMEQNFMEPFRTVFAIASMPHHSLHTQLCFLWAEYACSIHEWRMTFNIYTSKEWLKLGDHIDYWLLRECLSWLEVSPLGWPWMWRHRHSRSPVLHYLLFLSRKSLGRSSFCSTSKVWSE